VTYRLVDLEISYGDRVVLRIPSLQIEPGEIVGIAGESGSGKSTLATSLLGLSPHDGARVRGRFERDGDDLLALSEKQWRRVRGREIAMIFQDPASVFNPVQRIGKYAINAIRVHSRRSKEEIRAKLEAAFEELRLPPGLMERYPHQLSGGQLQRVAIAIGLAQEVRLLVADEATSALDVTVQAEILKTLRRIATDDGVAIVFVSHDLGALRSVCDHLVVLREGEIVEQGPIGDVISAPESEYTRELIRAVPVLTPVDTEEAS
jgi:peptide/nickel transport system ATP-binding protein